MVLYTKCIFHPPAPDDGVRISIMSRHTLNDGKTPDTRITSASYHEWLRTLAPPPHLVGTWYKGQLLWEEFEQHYLHHIRQKETAQQVYVLAQRALSHDITLLCVEETPEHCHRRLLAEECQRIMPEMLIILR